MTARSLALLAALLTGLTMGAANPPPAAGLVASVASSTSQPDQGTVVGGVRVDRLPRGIGRASDFRYRFGHVDFRSRVWESRNAEGSNRLDLEVTVARSARLSSAAAFHDWWLRYSQRQPRPAYLRVRLASGAGWLCRDEILRFLRPGVGLVIRLDAARFPTWSLVRMARSA